MQSHETTLNHNQCNLTTGMTERLCQHLHGVLPGVDAASSLSVRKFSHGQSNPTFLMTTKLGERFVLRKKPGGSKLVSAHAIEREYAVLSALEHTSVPVPQPLYFCSDEGVVGTPFYVMEYVNGRIFADAGLPTLEPSARCIIYKTMAKTLATLHSVDPDKVGLGQFGPRVRYASRQVSRWRNQYVKSVSQGDSPLPEMLQLADALTACIPDRDRDPSVTRISHGDFRLDNLVYHCNRNDTVLAILDWELATLGDPLADLAYCCLPWHIPTGLLPGLAFSTQCPPTGVPSEEDFVSVYCDSRGILMPDSSEWSFYVSLSLFRLAAILAGVGARARQGNASSKFAARIGAQEVVLSLAKKALELLALHAVKGPCASLTLEEESISRQNDNAPGRAATLLSRLRVFMREHVYPREHVLNAHISSQRRWEIHPAQEELKGIAKAAGLWNLWISPDLASAMRPSVVAAVSDPREQDLLLGPSLSNYEYAFLAEEMGRSMWASEACNCSAPDTGNMEVLGRYGSHFQKEKWLVPLLRGDIRSCFAMSEPAVASSDAKNIQASIRRDESSGGFIINAHKWWTSGAMDPRCQIAIVMGETRADPAAPPQKRQSLVLVPMDSAGLSVVRPLPVFGFDDAPHGHAELMFDNVRVPADAIILGEGRGFEVAQGRLGPGRLHHCMRLIGMGERAFDLMVKRSLSRSAFGKNLHMHQDVRAKIAQSRVDLTAARLVVLEAANALDQVGAKRARAKIAVAKLMTPSTVLQVIDRSIQVHGGAGVSDVTPLAWMWASARTLRLADGPDIVHMETIAKMELRRHVEEYRSKL